MCRTEQGRQLLQTVGAPANITTTTRISPSPEPPPRLLAANSSQLPSACVDSTLRKRGLLLLAVQCFHKPRPTGTVNLSTVIFSPAQLLHLGFPIKGDLKRFNSRTSRLAYSISSPSVLGQRYLDLVATTR